MLSIEEIRKKREEYNYTYKHLSVLSGVPLGTIQKVLGNVTKSPRYETMQALSAVFESSAPHRKISYLDDQAFGGEAHHQRNSEKTGRYDQTSGGEARSVSYVREPEPAYGMPNPGSVYRVSNPVLAMNWNTYDRQGSYTVEDYLALPDEQRVELIDGVIYDMGAPTSYHQLIGGEVHRQVSNYIHAHHGSCIPFIAPTDVQIDCDNRTMVQPDVLIVCDRSKINRRRVFGAPDFVLEVLSPSTRNKDIFIKGAKYMQAGVKEYWMVDPQKQTVTTCCFRDEDDTDIQMYTFEDQVPVALYNGDLVIDFKEIWEYISFIME